MHRFIHVYNPKSFATCLKAKLYPGIDCFIVLLCVVNKLFMSPNQNKHFFIKKKNIKTCFYLVILYSGLLY